MPKVCTLVFFIFVGISIYHVLMWSSSMHSGGNKRKLSTAIALVGNPSVIFLVSNSNYHFFPYTFIIMYVGPFYI